VDEPKRMISKYTSAPPDEKTAESLRGDDWNGKSRSRGLGVDVEPVWASEKHADGSAKATSSVVLPPVGVVIANHENEDYVREAIESVARQSVRNLDIVIVDDASTDGSDEIIRRTLVHLDDDRFRYIRLQENRGQAGALRRGLAVLDTPFVSFLDSDDVWYENFVASHLAAHLNADFPVALTYCDSHIIDAAGHLLAGTAWWFDFDAAEPLSRAVDPSRTAIVDPQAGSVTYALKPALTLHSRWSLDWSSNSMASMMFRRSFVDLVFTPADDDLRLYVDFYLSTCAALLTGAIAMNDSLYAYRMHGRNKHSNGSVLGGAYNSSKRPWEPVRDDIIRQVFMTLQNEASALRAAFGKHRYEQAVAQLRGVLSKNLSQRLMWNRGKWQDYLRGT
jgi:glycosyltransferase involved in cell wall biosynthesis